MHTCVLHVLAKLAGRVWDRYEESFYTCVELHGRIPALATSFDTCMLSTDAQGKQFNPQRYNLHFDTLNVLIM